jgi:hypothetical protein
MIDESVGGKLYNLPKIFVTTISPAANRQKKMREKFAFYGLQNYQFVFGEIAIDQSRKALDNACLKSHLNSIRHFLSESDLSWAIICEDDLNFDLVKFWPFTWEEKFEQVKGLGIEIMQLAIIVEREELFEAKLHPRKEMVDWSAGAYLLSRVGALKILEKHIDYELSVEENLFDGLSVFSEPILTCDTGDSTSMHYEHDSFHTMSFRLAQITMMERDT